MTPDAALAGPLAGLALLAAGRAPSADVRAVRLLQPLRAAGDPAGRIRGASGTKQRGLGSAGKPVAILAGVVVALMQGGIGGLILGGLAAGLLWRWLRHLEPAQARRQRLRLIADLPWAADLMGAAVDGGAPLDAAIRGVAQALGGPLGEELRSVAAALELGAPPALAWSGADPVLSGVGRSFARAADHGTPPSEHIGRLAEDLRAAAHAESAAALRGAGVHALAPLGACFLPAFLLLAVLPLVAGVAGQLLQ